MEKMDGTCVTRLHACKYRARQKIQRKNIHLAKPLEQDQETLSSSLSNDIHSTA